jgi:hypothetical protein
MLVWDIESVNQIEKSIPSCFAVGTEMHDRIEELWTNPVSQSILHGFLQLCLCIRKWKLDGSPLSIGHREGQDDGGVSMVERGTQVVHSISANYGKFRYDRFVLFGPDRALAGCCIRFQDIAEGTLFAQRFAKLSDVFRGPINLKTS